MKDALVEVVPKKIKDYETPGMNGGRGIMETMDKK